MKRFITILLISSIAFITSCGSDDDPKVEANGQHTYEITISGGENKGKLEGKLSHEQLALLYTEYPDVSEYKLVSTTLAVDNLSMTLVIPMENNIARPIKIDADGETNSLIVMSFEDTNSHLIGISGDVSVTNLKAQKITAYSGTASATISFNGLFQDSSDESKPPINVSGKIVVNK